MTIKLDVHLWTAMLVKTCLGIGHLVTGDDQATLDLRARTIAFTELEGFGSGFGSARLGGQTELKVGRLAQNTLGFGGAVFLE